MLNVERAERRKAARTLSAITAAFSEQIDDAWFEAICDSHEEATLMKTLHQIRSKSGTDVPVTEAD